MLTAPVRPVASPEIAIDVIVRAFAADPVARWMYPSDADYWRHFPVFARAFGGKAFAEGVAHVTTGVDGVALWLPPGVHPDEAPLVELVETTVAPERVADVFAVMGQMDGFHPAEPHWHLPMIGVVPERQGHGIGSALLRRGLELCDRAGLPAYLEASSTGSAALYARHGFEAVGTIQAGGSPPMFPMVRRPR